MRDKSMAGSPFNLLERIAGKVNKRLYRPDVKVSAGTSLRRAGTAYGGWVFEDRPSLRGGWIISCGLGEDASFDVEMANGPGAAILIVDPTPRAIAHFQEIAGRLGCPSQRGYVHGGKQPPESCDLSNVGRGQMVLEPQALWTESAPVRFHKPANPDNVSNSITFSAGGADDFILVPATTLNEILARYAISSVAMLKMDIEGAEVDILKSIASWQILPEQILVEFDVLRDAGPVSKKAVEEVDAMLRAQGFACVNVEDKNYTYVRS